MDPGTRAPRPCKLRRVALAKALPTNVFNTDEGDAAALRWQACGREAAPGLGPAWPPPSPPPRPAPDPGPAAPGPGRAAPPMPAAAVRMAMRRNAGRDPGALPCGLREGVAAALRCAQGLGPPAPAGPVEGAGGAPEARGGGAGGRCCWSSETEAAPTQCLVGEGWWAAVHQHREYVEPSKVWRRGALWGDGTAPVTAEL